MANSDQRSTRKPVSIPLYGPLTWRNTFSWIALILVVLLVRWVWFEPYTIPSGSMEPALHGDPRILRGDRVFIDKVRFGLRVPFKDARFIKGKSPERWDIAVFHSPDPNAEHPILIKRVVGLPGERIHIGEDGKVYVSPAPDGTLTALEPPDDVKTTAHYVQRIGPGDNLMRRWILSNLLVLIPEGMVVATDDVAEAKAYIDRLKKLQGLLASRDPMKLTDEEVNGITACLTEKDMKVVGANIHYRTFSEEYSRSVHREKPFRYGILQDDQYSLIPDGHYLMLGDNSNNSIDGRYFGWVPEDNIYGRAFCIWWPIGRMRDFTGFSATWYGMFFVYALPCIVFLWMFTRRFILRTCRVHEAAVGGTFGAGERLVVDCLAYGLRTPFFRPKAFIKPPKKNDIVLCYTGGPDETGEPHMILGYVLAVPGENGTRAAKKLSPGNYLIACDDNGAGRNSWTQHAVPHGNLIGRVVSVCWPIAGRRKVGELDPAKVAGLSTK